MHRSHLPGMDKLSVDEYSCPGCPIHHKSTQPQSEQNLSVTKTKTSDEKIHQGNSGFFSRDVSVAPSVFTASGIATLHRGLVLMK